MEQKDKAAFKERQRENKEPIQFGIYKGVRGKFGALRLSLKKAYTDEKRNTGCIFLDIAPTAAPNKYDWENSKMTLALSVTDISKIILFLRAPNHRVFDNDSSSDERALKIFHDKGAGTAERGQHTTTLKFSKPSEKTNIFVSAYQKSSGQTKNAMVPVSPDEVISVGTLLQAAIPLILAWN